MFIRSGYSAQTRRTASATQPHPSRAEVGLGLLDEARRLGPEARGAALDLEVTSAQRGQRDRVVLARRGAVGRGQHPHALEHDAVAAVADRDRERAVAPAVALAG